MASMYGMAELERLNSDYIAAVQGSDVQRFKGLLSEDFLNSNPDGSLVDRAGFLAQIARPPGIRNLAASDVRIRVLGDVAGWGRYTDIWQRRDGRWQCVAAHVTRG
jgi:ketosteroid isomerase-like protein